jgi:hypothetical protein
MFYLLYIILVLFANPTISSDLKDLGADQFKVREAATKRLGFLPSWTAQFFINYANHSTDPEVRIRCQRVYVALYRRQSIELDWLCLKIAREEQIQNMKNRR